MADYYRQELWRAVSKLTIDTLLSPLNHTTMMLISLVTAY